jgi:AcrR family transcriptional regulator
MRVTLTSSRATAPAPAPEAATPDAGLRERKKAKTRDALERAAIELFGRQGFERTTVEEIAAACDVSPRTFFRYFANKEDVLFARGEEKLSGLQAALAGRPVDETPWRALRASALALSSEFLHDRDDLLRMARVVKATPTLEIHGGERQSRFDATVYDELARREQAAGRTPSELELRLVVAAANAAFRASFETWLAADGTPDLGGLVEDAFDRLAVGFDTGIDLTRT